MPRPIGLAGTLRPTTPHHPDAGHLGVIAERRGRSHLDDLLTEITRIHAD